MEAARSPHVSPIHLSHPHVWSRDARRSVDVASTVEQGQRAVVAAALGSLTKCMKNQRAVVYGSLSDFSACTTVSERPLRHVRKLVLGGGLQQPLVAHRGRSRLEPTRATSEPLGADDRQRALLHGACHLSRCGVVGSVSGLPETITAVKQRGREKNKHPPPCDMLPASRACGGERCGGTARSRVSWARCKVFGCPGVVGTACVFSHTSPPSAVTNGRRCWQGCSRYTL